MGCRSLFEDKRTHSQIFKVDVVDSKIDVSKRVPVGRTHGERCSLFV